MDDLRFARTRWIATAACRFVTLATLAAGVARSTWPRFAPLATGRLERIAEVEGIRRFRTTIAVSIRWRDSDGTHHAVLPTVQPTTRIGQSGERTVRVDARGGVRTPARLVETWLAETCKAIVLLGGIAVAVSAAAGGAIARLVERPRGGPRTRGLLGRLAVPAAPLLFAALAKNEASPYPVPALAFVAQPFVIIAGFRAAWGPRSVAPASPAEGDIPRSWRPFAVALTLTLVWLHLNEVMTWALVELSVRGGAGDRGRALPLRFRGEAAGRREGAPLDDGAPGHGEAAREHRGAHHRQRAERHEHRGGERRDVAEHGQRGEDRVVGQREGQVAAHHAERAARSLEPRRSPTTRI